MDTIEAQRVMDTASRLTQGVHMNEKLKQFVTSMQRVLTSSDDFGNGKISVKTPGAHGAIEITTPHGNVVGVTEHTFDGKMIAARVRFFTVHIDAVGNASAKEIMTVSIDQKGGILAINEILFSGDKRFSDDDMTYEICMHVIASVHDKLPTTP